MRILPVTKEWPKLKNPRWPTFRLTRRDRDYEVGEVVQVVLHPRSKHRKVLGVAVIVGKEKRQLAYKGDRPKRPSVKLVSAKEAHEDGFSRLFLMRHWFWKTHGDRVLLEPLNKLTLEWVIEIPEPQMVILIDEADIYFDALKARKVPEGISHD